MRIKIIVSACLFIVLSACNKNGLINTSHNEVSIISEPAGASVYVMGELQGTTPMKVSVTKLYPVTYSQESAQHYGRITLKREGCNDRVVKVAHDIGASGLKEKLVCANDVDTNGQPTATDKTVKQRLQELQSLKDDGLVNEEEYQKLRRRILESL